MRCALDFDENKPLFDQNVNAWGEMQSLSEEPSYREEDIKDDKDKEFFRGYKYACDEICNYLEDLDDNELSNDIQTCMAGNIAMQLFSILDNQEENS